VFCLATMRDDGQTSVRRRLLGRILTSVCVWDNANANPMGFAYEWIGAFHTRERGGAGSVQPSAALREAPPPRARTPPGGPGGCRWCAACGPAARPAAAQGRAPPPQPLTLGGAHRGSKTGTTASALPVSERMEHLMATPSERNTSRAGAVSGEPPAGPFVLPGCDLFLRFDGFRWACAVSPLRSEGEGGLRMDGLRKEGGGAGVLVDGRPGLVHLVGGSGRRARPVGTSLRSHPKRWVQLTNGAAVVLGPPTGREPMKQAHHRTHNVNEHTTYHLPRTLVGQTTVRQLLKQIAGHTTKKDDRIFFVSCIFLIELNFI